MLFRFRKQEERKIKFKNCRHDSKDNYLHTNIRSTTFKLRFFRFEKKKEKRRTERIARKHTIQKIIIRTEIWGFTIITQIIISRRADYF